MIEFVWVITELTEKNEEMMGTASVVDGTDLRRDRRLSESNVSALIGDSYFTSDQCLIRYFRCRFNLFHWLEENVCEEKEIKYNIRKTLKKCIEKNKFQISCYYTSKSFKDFFGGKNCFMGSLDIPDHRHSLFNVIQLKQRQTSWRAIKVLQEL